MIMEVKMGEVQNNAEITEVSDLLLCPCTSPHNSSQAAETQHQGSPSTQSVHYCTWCVEQPALEATRQLSASNNREKPLT